MSERLNEFITKQENLINKKDPFGPLRYNFMKENYELLNEYSDIEEEIKQHFGVDE